jgi:hypothetical protein
MIRHVDDIMWIGRAPVAYIRVPDHRFQCICPFCAQDVGKKFSIGIATFGNLYEKLYDMMSDHIKVCSEKTRLNDNLKVSEKEIV